jgi:hypothetical protein
MSHFLLYLSQKFNMRIESSLPFYVRFPFIACFSFCAQILSLRPFASLREERSVVRGYQVAVNGA